MPYNQYDPKILEFLYFLVRNNRYMTFKEVSERFKLEKNGKSFTYRTILRWAHELRKTRAFNYYPNIKASNFGLLPLFVYLKDLRNSDIVNIMPYKLYMEYGTDLKTLKNAVFIEYLIPPDYIEDFYEFWKKAKESGVIGDFVGFKVRSAVAFYPPFHLVVDSKGNLNFDIDFDITMYMKILEKSIEKDVNIGIHEEIQKNPMIVPVALSMDKEPHLSYRQLWRFVKKLTGNSIWDYLDTKKENFDKNEEACVGHIRRTVDSFISNKDLVRQIRVSYDPFYEKNLGTYLIIKPKDRESLLKISEIMAKRSILLVISSPYDMTTGSAIYYFVTNPVKTSEILEEIKDFIDRKYETISFLRNHEKTIPFLMGATPDTPVSKVRYWEVFDPVNVEWKYDHEKYMKELDRLSKRQ